MLALRSRRILLPINRQFVDRCRSPSPVDRHQGRAATESAVTDIFRTSCSLALTAMEYRCSAEWWQREGQGAESDCGAEVGVQAVPSRFVRASRCRPTAEHGVALDSIRERPSPRLLVDNWRWADTPFVRMGKRSPGARHDRDPPGFAPAVRNRRRR